MMGAVTDLFVEGAADLIDDARLLLREIDREVPGAASVTADCRPPLDVMQTAAAVEVVMDIPGVPSACLRVAIRRSVLLIVGSKPAGPLEAKARFHLAERGYGRFARAVRLDGALDGHGARASVVGGQLRIVLPLIEERRGQLISIPVERS
jgi:HSP20 family protein